MADELIELGRAKCKQGEILRRGYITRTGVRVPPTCVTDQGAPGKTPASKRVLPKPTPGAIGPWKKDASPAKRHSAIKQAVRRRGCRKVIGSLTLLRNLSADPGTKATAKKDAQWLHKQPFCKLKSKK